MSAFFFKNQVKQILRMCGHALVTTIHERLDGIDKQIGVIVEQNTSLARTQTALLQSNTYMVEKFQATEANQVSEALEQIAKIQLQMPKATDVGEALEQIAETQARMLRVLEQQPICRVAVEPDDYACANPEVGLMAFLYSYLPSRKALDIGAHVGNVSARLLETGYEVYAFEPYTPTYRKLVSRLGGSKAFRHFNFALGRTEAEATLHIAADRSPNGRHNDITQFNSISLHSTPDDLPFTEKVTVPVKPLMALQPDLVPDDVGLVKIDTEGYDLEVIRGMGDRTYPVVMVEFWDTRMPFGTSGLLYTLETMVAEMRSRGYGWHIVLYRVYGGEDVAFFCNHDRPIPASWGNIFFFRDHPTFAQAERWCSSVLPRTYFKPAPSDQARPVGAGN